MLSRRRFLALAPTALAVCSGAPRLLVAADPPAIAASALRLPHIGASQRSLPPSELTTAVLTPASAKYCRIMQFTDLHLFQQTGDVDELTLNECRQQFRWNKPDLLMFTGDIWHENHSGRGLKQLEFLIEQVAAWSIPWAFCWGNHDKLDDYQRGHELLEAAPLSLYRGGQSHGNYRVEVRPAATRATKPPALDLFCLNTSEEGLRSLQARWLNDVTDHLRRTRAQPTPAFAFFHIPVPEYESRIQAGNFHGVKLEVWGHPPRESEGYAALTRSRTIRAGFCGHCHGNDYVVKTGAIDLVFGRSTGRGSYGSELLRKGAKVIEIELATGQYQQRTVFADGSEWLA